MTSTGSGGADQPPRTGPFTEIDARRLGPVRRFFVRRPAAMDAVVVAVFVLLGLLSALLPFDREPSLPAAGFVVAGGAALTWRRRQPVTVTVVVGVLAALALASTGTLAGFDLGVGLALYAVAASRASRVAWTAAAVLVSTTSLAVWLWEQSALDPTTAPFPDGADPVLVDDRISTVTALVIFALGAMALGTSVRNRRLHLADLLDRANALARDQERQAQLARAAERTRIAREMHDVVAHSVSVMIALADGAASAMDRAPERSRVALGELSATGRSALADMRRVLGVLAEDSEAPLTPQPGAADLDALVERFRTAGLPVVTSGLSTPLPGSAALQLTVYRIVQESLTNALRHAPATPRVDVRLAVRPGQVEVEVSDHGAGAPRRESGGAGQGLLGMRERASVLGGTVEAGPTEHGWRVHAALPWEEEP